MWLRRKAAARHGLLASVVVLATVAGIAAASGPKAASGQASPNNSDSTCAELFGFAAEPVPVVKAPDGQTILASVKWGHSPELNLCYLVLDDTATNTLRANPPSPANQSPTDADAAAAAKCHNAYNPNRGFAAEPVPVVKSTDGQTVLASVKWGYSSDHDICFLILDDAAQQALRAHHACQSDATSPECPSSQDPSDQELRHALTVLYNTTDGPNWTRNTNWSTDEPLDTWWGVRTSENALTRLNLSNNNLSGTIPPEIGNLTELTVLDLSNNSLSGSIPPEIGNLTELIRLDLFNNSLSGPIPPEIGNLTELTVLDLSNNSLSGSIPPEIGNLTELIRLDLFYNSLSGSIPPEIGNLTELTSLYLPPNNLAGMCIPSELTNWYEGISSVHEPFPNCDNASPLQGPLIAYTLTHDYDYPNTQYEASLWVADTEGNKKMLAVSSLVDYHFDRDEMAFSPDGKWVAIPSRTRSLHSRLVNIDTGQERLLRGNYNQLSAGWGDHPARAEFFRWSPDSNYLTYIYDGAVWAEHIGEGTRQVIAEPPVILTPSDFSDDSKFVSYFEHTNSGLTVVNLTTGDEVTPGNRQQNRLARGRFVPGGSLVWVIFTHTDTRSRDGGSRSDLWIMDPTGSNMQLIATDIATFRPAWSPDGKRVAYRTFQQGEWLQVLDDSGAILEETPPGYNWVIADHSGTILGEIPRSGTCESPFWANNERIILPYADHTDTVSTKDYIPVDLQLSGNYFDYHTKPSRDLTKYADAFDSRSLSIVDIDGKNRTTLIDDIGNSSRIVSISWSPDDKYIALLVDSEDVSEATPSLGPSDPNTRNITRSIWVVDVNSGNRHKIVEAKGDPRQGLLINFLSFRWAYN